MPSRSVRHIDQTTGKVTLDDGTVVDNGPPPALERRETREASLKDYQDRMATWLDELCEATQTEFDDIRLFSDLADDDPDRSPQATLDRMYGGKMFHADPYVIYRTTEVKFFIGDDGDVMAATAEFCP